MRIARSTPDPAGQQHSPGTGETHNNAAPQRQPVRLALGSSVSRERALLHQLRQEGADLRNERDNHEHRDEGNDVRQRRKAHLLD